MNEGERATARDWAKAIHRYRAAARRLGRHQGLDLDDMLLVLRAEAVENGDHLGVELCERSLAVETLDRSLGL